MNDLVARFADDDAEEARAAAAEGLYGLAVAMRRRDDFDGAFQVYDRFIAIFGVDPALKVRRRLVSAMMNKGFILMQLLDLPAEALPVYDDLFRRFTGPVDDETLADRLEKARRSRELCVTRLSTVREADRDPVRTKRRLFGRRAK